MSEKFDYLIRKISEADFRDEPFSHLYIENFFSPADFSVFVSAEEIAIRPAQSDEELFVSLFGAGYEVIGFPGCVTDKKAYLAWHAKRKKTNIQHSALEGFGMTLRLVKPRTEMLVELNAFLASERFNTALAQKFGLEGDACESDSGIQKYLDGYEISPHPDMRSKALTYMLNLNPHPDSEKLDHHTHYLKLADNRRYVQSFWEGNPEAERCWVPWDWCTTYKMQRANNSIVIFSPSNETMHGVKTNYDHLQGQRTQIYGNLWFKNPPKRTQIEWEDLDILSAHRRDRKRRRSPRKRLAKLLSKSKKRMIEKARGSS